MPKLLKQSEKRLIEYDAISKELLFSPNDLKQLKATLLHESIFSFYKSFYNYIMAKNLQLSGDTIWYKITLYYSKLYVARAVNTLFGKQRYGVRSDGDYFIPMIFKLLRKQKFNEIVKKYDNDINKVDWENERRSYTIELDINLTGDCKVFFTNDNIQSHREIFEEYHSEYISNLTFPRFEFRGFSWQDLIDERNAENYSFEGYRKLDFNLHERSFSSYYNEINSKEEANLVYDIESADYLHVFKSLYHMFKEMVIHKLPIEKYKFSDIIQQSLLNKELKEKLTDLVNKDFPMRNKYQSEMHDYYES